MKHSALFHKDKDSFNTSGENSQPLPEPAVMAKISKAPFEEGEGETEDCKRVVNSNSSGIGHPICSIYGVLLAVW